MEKEESSKDTSSSNNSINSHKFAKGSLNYMRQVSGNLLEKPKKLATSLLKAHERKRSVSTNDILSLDIKKMHAHSPGFPKVQSLGREVQMRSSSSYSDLGDNTSVAAAKRYTLPYIRPQIFISADDSREGYNTSPITHDSHAYFNAGPTDSVSSPTDVNIIKQEITQCNNDVREFQTSINLFKKEFLEGIENINEKIKEDEDQHTRIYNKIHYITDLHQKQLEYLKTTIEDMDKDINTAKDDCIIDVLQEKLSILETRIGNL
jgi:hypothetical protein